MTTLNSLVSVCALGALVFMGLGCAAQTAPDGSADVGDDPVGSAEQASTLAGCPNPTILSSDTPLTPFGFANPCSGFTAGPQTLANQYFNDGQPDLTTGQLAEQCAAYCNPTADPLSVCASGWSLTNVGQVNGFQTMILSLSGGNLATGQDPNGQSVSCFNRSGPVHRWQANCICP